MITLVIVMSLAIGKIRGQLIAVPGAINVRLVPTLPVDPRTFIVPEQGRLSPQFLQQNPAQRSSIDWSRTGAISRGDPNLRPLTLETRPNRTLFIPEQTRDISSRHEVVTNDTTKINVEQFSTPTKRLVNMNPNDGSLVEENSATLEINRTATTSVVTNNSKDQNTTEGQGMPAVDKSKAKINETKEMEGPAGKPSSPSVIDKATGVEVTLDERASFDGDKCPTGYVRINGMCVEKD